MIGVDPNEKKSPDPNTVTQEDLDKLISSKQSIKKKEKPPVSNILQQDEIDNMLGAAEASAKAEDKKINPADADGDGRVSIPEAISQDFRERRNAIVQVSNNLKSSRFILAMTIIVPSMICYGYGMRLAGTDFKDVLQMIDKLVVMIVVFYFCQKQYERTQNNDKDE